MNKRVFDIVKQPKERAVLEKELRESLKGAPNIDATIASVLSPWLLFFIRYDPRPTLEKVRCPVLAINGSKDVQVAPKENLAAIAAALRKGGNEQVTCKELPSLNHLLQKCVTGLPAEYGKIEETMSEEALALIGDWIAERSRK
jgi:fermentation-respiration switch protein FrsA (DUF1100 family)